MNKITDILKKKLALKIYNLARQKYLKSTLGEYGKIVEYDDKIVVNATQKLVDRNGKNIFYELRCSGMNIHIEEIKKNVELFKLNKPVYFIFDGIIFDTPVILSSYFCNVIFKNCTFTNGLRSFHADNLTLENNTYNSWTSRKSFLSGHYNELTIKNDNFINSYKLKKYGENKFGMNIDSNKVYIINSNISAESKGDINIKSGELCIRDSNISAPEIYIDSDSIKTYYSRFESDNGMIIDNKDSDFTYYASDVKSPIFIYNDTDLYANDDFVPIDKDSIELNKYRRELLNKLRNLRNYCNQVSEKELHTVKKQLNNQTVNQLLKKKKI